MSLPPSRVITRNRERLACKECRRRKLKCDRSSPCGSCVRRGDEASCTYQRVTQAAEERLGPRVETQARLEHLEQLVQQLASQPTGPTASTNSVTTLTPPLEAGGESLGSASHNGNSGADNGLSYNGATHWSAMLADIQELRLAMPVGDTFVSDSYADDQGESKGVEILFGGTPPLPLNIILATYLPPRQEVDRMISAYFRAEAVAAPFIHASQFRRLYREFWENQTLASPLWISILFSICHISANALRRRDDGPHPGNQFSVAAAQCLAIGEYFRPKRFSVEALTLFTQAQCLTSTELPADIGALSGLITRLATRMGYHRDPDRFKLSPFDKEMRRRTWSFCMQLDVIISFHLGLPTGVQYPTWDTKIPSALADSEFDEDSLELPPVQANNDINHLSLYLAKHKFLAVLEKILRHTLSTSPDASDVEKLDAEVRAIYDPLPEPLKPQSMADSVVDSANLIVTRLCVSFVYYKCLCVLHRPYVTQGRLESIAICYEAATHLTGDFVDAYYEFTPGGQAETESWFLSAISWHDFLFGTMALCLVLCTASRGPGHPIIDRTASLRLLDKARKLCIDQEARRQDTRRVLTLVDTVIAKLGLEDDSSPNYMLEGSDSLIGIPMAKLQDFQIMNWDPTWDTGETMTGLAQDSSWDYFEQFLNVNIVPQD
ncbi:hypothetical protein AB5N19_11703 [Seiridium cardinale]